MSDYFTQLTEKLVELPVATWIVIGALILLGVLLLFLRRQKFTARMLSVGALCVAVGFVLSNLVLFRAPQGGSVTPASMLPILAYAWAFGPAAGIVAGIAHGCLQLVQGPSIIHPAQLIMDYILPFTLLGFAGFFKKNFFVGIVVACFLRFLCHYFAGVIFWGEYAPEGQSPYLYSLGYNGFYMLIDTAICMALAAVPSVRNVIQGIKQPMVKA